MDPVLWIVTLWLAFNAAIATGLVAVGLRDSGRPGRDRSSRRRLR
ncbi:MAG: hypothetical protein AB7G37_04535 [Solirubrobacteraceae bacterium]